MTTGNNKTDIIKFSLFFCHEGRKKECSQNAIFSPRFYNLQLSLWQPTNSLTYVYLAWNRVYVFYSVLPRFRKKMRRRQSEPCLCTYVLCTAGTALYVRTLEWTPSAGYSFLFCVKEAKEWGRLKRATSISGILLIKRSCSA